ncbi:MAG: MBL fold metallo-hydrolase [Rubrivivax sp.]|nr:MBL fold metallo-hydrolase [Rubrivivax sp.]
MARAAHPATVAAHERTAGELEFGDTRDFEDARRGFIATIPEAEIAARAGGLAWTMRGHAFLEGPRPDTVNPSLWRMARLNRVHGLFEVCPRIYQVRGFCLANITFVEGDEGIIVIDPLTFTEHAEAALALYRAHRGARPVKAVVYTHSHRDHYGGVRGVVSPEQVAAERIPVIAPEGFTEEAFAESMLAGVPMRRRSLYQFGTALPAGPEAHVDSGLGKAVGRGGDGFIAPTLSIRAPRERHVVDGVTIEFQLTPGAEAPAEMNLFFPGLRALNLAENACQTMHNLCPLRGAKTRDALAWSRYLDDALDEYVPHCDVVYAQHHWPVWGAARIAEYVAGQRDLYRYLHDQTLRLMSQGRTPAETGEELMLPNALARKWFARGYYGAVAHNVAAIYAHYLGPYDGHPAHLNPHPPVAAAARYVRYMGGADSVVARAAADYEAGDFRWVVQVLEHVVFADPGHRAARELAADAMEQLGYQAESATWRNSYLQAARELRSRGAPAVPAGIAISPDVVAQLPLAKFLEFLAIRVNGPRAQELQARLDWQLPGSAGGGDECQRVTLVNGALNHRPGSHGSAADVVIRTPRAQLARLLQGPEEMLRCLDAGEIDITGDKTLLRRLVLALDAFDPMFNVVEP